MNIEELYPPSLTPSSAIWLSPRTQMMMAAFSIPERTAHRSLHFPHPYISHSLSFSKPLSPTPTHAISLLVIDCFIGGADVCSNGTGLSLSDTCSIGLLLPWFPLHSSITSSSPNKPTFPCLRINDLFRREEGLRNL